MARWESGGGGSHGVSGGGGGGEPVSRHAADSDTDAYPCIRSHCFETIQKKIGRLTVKLKLSSSPRYARPHPITVSLSG